MVAYAGGNITHYCILIIATALNLFDLQKIVPHEYLAFLLKKSVLTLMGKKSPKELIRRIKDNGK
tara:strand:- start:251 stop:445 length:195 start_codon:yes stop_codon:yes gene_type:complete